MMGSRIVVIGGGPAGVMAAGRAAQCGASAVLLEKGPRLGRKLRISGKGRGNITNTADLREFIEAFSPNGKFLYGAFSRFFRDDLLDLLRSQGVETKVERGGRVFPVSDRASDVADALERWMLACGARVKTDARARSVVVRDGRVIGVEVFGGTMKADAAVIATGGASYPKTGSTGDGYLMARDAGHTIIAPKPALSALVCEEDWVRDVQGLSLRNVEATLFLDIPGQERPRKIASEFGEMLFTHFGVSGPIILTLSRGVGDLVAKGRVTVSIDLKPALSKEQLHARLVRDFRQTKHVRNYLRDLLPGSLIDVFVGLAGLDPEKPVNVVTARERAKMVELLKDLRVTVMGMGPLDQAIVTSGGVSIREIDPRTMMSTLVDGLFFAGEVIDIDAETGGFNLQAAFSTGWVAGEAAADYVRRERR
jgi:predicted Rossmann fold flavoprotein